MGIYKFESYTPVIHESSFVHPTASVIGNVIIGKDVYIGPGASLRGDFGEIIIEDGCNVQDNCIIHMFPGVTVLLKENSHIGHGAVIHGAVIGYNSLIGMNSVIMDNVVIGDECIVGALSFVASDSNIPNRKVVVGNPARIIKDVSDKMISWKTEGTKLYQNLPKRYENLTECEPLKEVEKSRQKQDSSYEIWVKRKSI